MGANRLPRSFGIELEMAGSDCYADKGHPTARVSVAAPSTPLDRYPRTKSYNIEMLPGWSAHYDGSCGPEFVSPVLRSLEPVYRMAANIRKHFEPTFNNAGLHIHVDATDFDEQSIMNVARFGRFFDRTIASFFHPGRRKSTYCGLLGKCDKALREQMADRSLSRYHGLNLMSWHKHGTVEFRYSEGHMNLDKITAMVHFYVAIIEWCANNPAGNFGCKPNLAEKRIYLLNLLGLDETTKRVMLEAKY